MKNKVTAPRHVVIKGQPHHLSYINDQEQGLLMALGGSGTAGPMGIPQYSYGDGDFGQDDPMSDATAGAGPSGGNGPSDGDKSGDGTSYATDAEVDFPTTASLHSNIVDNPNKTQSDLNRALDEAGYYDAIVDHYTNPDTAGLFAPSVYSSKLLGGSIIDGFKNVLAGKGFNTGAVPSYSNWFDFMPTKGLFTNKALGQINSRIDQYANPQSKLGSLVAPLQTYFANNIKDALLAGGRPVFDATGTLQGAFTKNGLGFEVYTGNPVDGLPETGWSDPTNQREETVKPVNPLTGTCESGYIFDEDLNACRLDTGAGAGGGAGGGNFGVSGETYYRPNALDNAPANIPAYMGPNYNYNQANKNFVQTYAYNPDYYENQMDITGFAPVSGILV